MSDRTLLAGQRKDRQRRERAAQRRRELALLLAASVVVVAALAAVFLAQTGRLENFAADTRQGRILLLDRDASADRIARHLRVMEHPQDREFAAGRIRAEILRQKGSLPNVGAIGRILVSERDVSRHSVELPARLATARQRALEREQQGLARRGWYGRLRDQIKERLSRPQQPPVQVPLLNGQQLAAWKPLVAVRTIDAFRRSFLLWSALSILIFYAIHLWWRLRGFAGDNTLLPAIHLLTGLGLALMVSLRDPVRDTLIFRDFAQGIVLGSLLLAVCAAANWEAVARFTWVPLLASLALALLLVAFGSGPAGSGAKVNLFSFQPVELIRVLLVLFLAGYFGRNWDLLRAMRQHGGPLAGIARALHIARFDYTLPVFLGVALSVVLFFLLRDMGPALVVGCLFLALHSIARNSFRLGVVGVLLILAGFLAGYRAGEPETVRDRVDMWLSIWDNPARGGDQVAHSLWSLSAGGFTGTGLGLGYPQSIPAGHTDLILSVFGEQFGYLGLAALLFVYAALYGRCLRIAMRAPSASTCFLVLGLTLIGAFQFVLIAAGILGLAPLSGVVTPLLSYGRSSMLVNLAAFGIILSISSQPGKDHAPSFAIPVRRISQVLAACAVLILGRAAWHQVIRADDTLLRGSLVKNADGVRRYGYNPRLQAAARLIPKGDISDRNGLPLATSDFAQVEARRKDYAALGVSVERTTAFLDRRHYPLGPQMFYVLGDTRSPLRRGARNTAFEEFRSRTRLQGFDDGIEVEEAKDPETGETVRRLKFDYRELLPLVRHRWEPDNEQVKTLLARPRSVRLSLDARLQMRVSAIVEQHLKKLRRERAAVVMMDAASGDLLASVSYPWPAWSQIDPLQSSPQSPVAEELLLDRARYGLYPPGSSFKLVTSIAALRRDPALESRTHTCVRLPDGRVGATLRGTSRPVRDDIMDRSPHGTVNLARAIVVSCNAYFAQLASFDVGADALFDTAALLGISMANPNTPRELEKYLPQSAYGQGEVVATPFQMARVAATIAAGGAMPYGRWILDESNPRSEEPRRLISQEQAELLGSAMRNAVVSGTGRSANDPSLLIAGKTGTAELKNRSSHAWFIGYAPHGAPGRKIAFAVLVENGGYGGRSAAPLAAEVVAAAKQLGLLE